MRTMTDSSRPSPVRMPLRTKHRHDSGLTVIVPARGWALPSLTELADYRDLLFFLAIRNIKVRYRQTILGGAWAVLQPLLTMAVMTVVLGKFISVPSGSSAPYWLFALSGLVLWSFVSQSVSATSWSLVVNGQLIEKVYFPRLAIPVSVVAASLVDAAVSFTVLVLVLLAT